MPIGSYLRMLNAERRVACVELWDPVDRCNFHKSERDSNEIYFIQHHFSEGHESDVCCCIILVQDVNILLVKKIISTCFSFFEKPSRVLFPLAHWKLTVELQGTLFASWSSSCSSWSQLTEFFYMKKVLTRW